MWISVTTTKQKRTLVNLNSVLHLNEHPTGTQIIFAANADKQEGGQAPLALYVQEPIEAIERILKARRPRY
ncbi:hypothetical protein CN082_33405 [Sinorhizobium meliloti]|nr:hypothetical protein CN082_33405 [Sinorhizobium meliloti]